jgi:maltose alpha-D-glucosyltransferase / alpha-amylase
MVRSGRRPYGRLEMEGYGYRWYRLGGLDYLLKRTDIDTDAAKFADRRAN